MLADPAQRFDAETKLAVTVGRLSRGGYIRPTSACEADLVALIATCCWTEKHCTPKRLYETVHSLGDMFTDIETSQVAHLPVFKKWPSKLEDLQPAVYNAMYTDSDDDKPVGMVFPTFAAIRKKISCRSNNKNLQGHGVVPKKASLALTCDPRQTSAPFVNAHSFGTGSEFNFHQFLKAASKTGLSQAQAFELGCQMAMGAGSGITFAPDSVPTSGPVIEEVTEGDVPMTLDKLLGDKKTPTKPDAQSTRSSASSSSPEVAGAGQSSPASASNGERESPNVPLVDGCSASVGDDARPHGNAFAAALSDCRLATKQAATAARLLNAKARVDEMEGEFESVIAQADEKKRAVAAAERAAAAAAAASAAKGAGAAGAGAAAPAHAGSSRKAPASDSFGQGGGSHAKRRRTLAAKRPAAARGGAVAAPPAGGSHSLEEPAPALVLSDAPSMPASGTVRYLGAKIGLSNAKKSFRVWLDPAKVGQEKLIKFGECKTSSWRETLKYVRDERAKAD